LIDYCSFRFTLTFLNLSLLVIYLPQEYRADEVSRKIKINIFFRYAYPPPDKPLGYPPKVTPPKVSPPKATPPKAAPVKADPPKVTTSRPAETTTG
jgi:hypothetical protein